MILKFLLGFLVLSMVFSFAYGVSWLNKKFPDIKIFIVVAFFGSLAIYVIGRGCYEIGNLLLSSF